MNSDYHTLALNRFTQFDPDAEISATEITLSHQLNVAAFLTSAEDIEALNRACCRAVKTSAPTISCELSCQLAKAVPHPVLLYNAAKICLINDPNNPTAVALLQQAITAQPDFAASYFELGLFYQQQSDLQQAERYYQRAVEHAPQLTAAWHNLGYVAEQQQQWSQAVDCYTRAVDCDPNFAASWHNLGNCLRKLGRPASALPVAQQAYQLNPELSTAINLANTYLKLEQYQLAAHLLQDWVTKHPHYANAQLNLAHAYLGMRNHEQALQHYLQALALNPHLTTAQVYGYFAARACCDWQISTKLASQVDQQTLQALQQGRKPSEDPFINLVRSQDEAQNAAVAKAFSTAMAPAQAYTYPCQIEAQQPTLKLGLLSSDFYPHPTFYLLEQMLAAYDPQQFDIVLFGYGPRTCQTTLAPWLARGMRYIELHGCDDAAAAKRIYQQHLDLLIDLKGHTQGNRMPICAYRPAPVQIAYLGFPGTTGATYFDYVIADPIVVPPRVRQHYTEKILYLTPCYQVNPSPNLAPAPARGEVGLPATGCVYSAINQSYKLSPGLFEGWLAILSAVPDSVLWLQVAHPNAQQRLYQLAERASIDPNRLIFAPWMPQLEHLARLKCADVFLDSLDYNGHTTTSDHLRCGVPVVTLSGGHFASRVSASLLHALGLGDWIAQDEAGYREFAIELGRNPTRLHATHTRLQAALQQCCVFQPTVYAEKWFDLLQHACKLQPA